MAATRLIALHQNKGKTIAQSLGDRTDYAKNPEKGELVTAYQCDPFTVDEDFMLSKRKYEQSVGRQQKGNVIAYQIRQSFKPGEITPEKANQVGQELAMRFTKGKHAFIVATHTDKAHIHNHIVFNSTAIDGSRKFKNFWFSGLALQKLSDLICLENGLLSRVRPGQLSPEYFPFLPFPYRNHFGSTLEGNSSDGLLQLNPWKTLLHGKNSPAPNREYRNRGVPPLMETILNSFRVPSSFSARTPICFTILMLSIVIPPPVL